MNHTLSPGQIATKLIPVNFGLVACGRRKQPYKAEWQKNPLDAAAIGREIKAKRCHAVGVLCGEPSGGLLFLDHDGESCDGLIEELSGVPLQDALPKTFVVSSGKPGRAQYVYRIPEMFWGAIATHKVATGTKSVDGKPEQLEFRWNGCQSIIQGAHPDTDGYRWEGTPEDIVDAPLWMVTQMLADTVADDPLPLAQAPMSDIDWALSYLEAIPTTEDYDQWLHVGMALHSVSDTLLPEWDAWSRPASNYSGKDCAAKWKSFKRSGKGIGYLGWLAKSHGWTSPIPKAPTLSAPSSTTKKKTKGKDKTHDEIQEAVVTEREWEQFKTTLQSPGGFDPFNWLPQRLADLARGDAMKNCIDPLGIWAYLMPATLSMMGANTGVAMGSWYNPSIIWSLVVGASGTGKSRIESLVLEPLKKMNVAEHSSWKERKARWLQLEKEALRNKDAGPDDGPGDPPQPRRYLINQSTPEGIVKRLAGQDGHGTLCYRDEFAGMISGLSQYKSGGKGDGMEMLLETWDGKSLLVDRANVDDSFAVESSRMSLAGGIQPGMFERTFETAEDSQGVLARFMIVVPKELPYKRYKGPLLLPAELTKIYTWIDTVEWGTIHPTDEADDLFTEISENFLNQKAPSANAQPWVRKLAGQTVRIAMAIHALECYYDRTKDTGILTEDTLARAYHMAKHYQSHFYHLMGMSASEGLTGVLLLIQELACGCEGGITASDIVRGRGGSKLQNMARHEGCTTKELCGRLFQELADSGYGTVEEFVSGNNRRTVIYRAFADKCSEQTQQRSEPTVDDPGNFRPHPEMVEAVSKVATETTENEMVEPSPSGATVEAVVVPEAAQDLTPPIPVGSVVRINYSHMDPAEVERNVESLGWLPQGTECFVDRLEYEYDDLVDEHFWMADVLSPDSTFPFRVGVALLEIVEP